MATLKDINPAYVLFLIFTFPPTLVFALSLFSNTDRVVQIPEIRPSHPSVKCMQASSSTPQYLSSFQNDCSIFIEQQFTLRKAPTLYALNWKFVSASPLNTYDWNAAEMKSNWTGSSGSCEISIEVSQALTFGIFSEIKKSIGRIEDDCVKRDGIGGTEKFKVKNKNWYLPPALCFVSMRDKHVPIRQSSALETYAASAAGLGSTISRLPGLSETAQHVCAWCYNLRGSFDTQQAESCKSCCKMVMGVCGIGAGVTFSALHMPSPAVASFLGGCALIGDSILSWCGNPKQAWMHGTEHDRSTAERNRLLAKKEHRLSNWRVAELPDRIKEEYPFRDRYTNGLKKYNK